MPNMSATVTYFNNGNVQSDRVYMDIPVGMAHLIESMLEKEARANLRKATRTQSIEGMMYYTNGASAMLCMSMALTESLFTGSTVTAHV